jgi:hypothetical protein
LQNSFEVFLYVLMQDRYWKVLYEECCQWIASVYGWLFCWWPVEQQVSNRYFFSVFHIIWILWKYYNKQ